MRVPRHIAIIMDGNGRWAAARGLPRIAGHREGARRVRGVVEECARLGVEALTLYSFSSENWKRPEDEVTALMELARHQLQLERQMMLANNICFRRIGRRQGLSAPVLAEFDRTEDETSNCTGMTLCLAMNYGSRQEMVDAVRAIALRVRRGDLDPAAIDEETMSAALETHGLPDPDLLVRTAGERRLSNFLLWQVSYAEIYVTDVLWPEFKVPELQAAIADFAARRRTYGGLGGARPAAAT
ncbi:MAG: polyprenyl diphosphate synthase [Planctomycetota bacterium]|nr:polyprenyl diphosphate synthase [Planctomycetota bacterium]